MLYKIYGKTSKIWKLVEEKKNKKDYLQFIKEAAALYPNILVIQHNERQQIDEVVAFQLQQEKLDFFKIYVSTKKDWYYLATIYQEKGLKKFISKINKSLYDRIMVIYHDATLNYDELYMMQYLDSGKRRIRKKDWKLKKVSK